MCARVLRLSDRGLLVRGDFAASPARSGNGVPVSKSWLARLSLVLMLAAAAVLIGFAGLRSLSLVGIGALGACAILAGGYWFLANRGPRRWLAVALVILAPIALLVLYARHHLVWVAAVSVGLSVLAVITARVSLSNGGENAAMPAYPASPPHRAFIVMNPRSGGGKVAKFGLKEKAKALGAQVAMLEGPDIVDVAALARQAVAEGCDLLGVAGGDGTQALVAEIAAEHGLPFLVISAGTRNHFALDLGLNRDDPATCLDALTDGEEVRVDLGIIGDRTFVNNASFGAYAEVVRSPAYRDDKRGTTLQMMPDLLNGHRGARLAAHAGGVTIEGPRALLVSNNPYETGDVAGLGRRARLDAGTLGVVAIEVGSARQAIALMNRRNDRGLTVLTDDEVIVDADQPEIPVGIDGETVMMPAPVRCAIRPGALTVLVPKDRPGVRAPRAPFDWASLRRQASLAPSFHDIKLPALRR
jgi:diacylglycerol kinase family enzyme